MKTAMVVSNAGALRRRKREISQYVARLKENRTLLAEACERLRLRQEERERRALETPPVEQPVATVKFGSRDVWVFKDGLCRWVDTGQILTVREFDQLDKKRNWGRYVLSVMGWMLAIACSFVFVWGLVTHWTFDTRQSAAAQQCAT